MRSVLHTQMLKHILIVSRFYFYYIQLISPLLLMMHELSTGFAFSFAKSERMTMSRRKIISLGLPAVLNIFVCIGAFAQVKESTPAPVRQVDHIMIRTDDHSKLYAFFTEILQLPVAWPLATRGDVTSGGASFGNANVEAIRRHLTRNWSGLDLSLPRWMNASPN